MIYDIPDKVKEKWGMELIELHKRLVVTYLAQKGLRTTKQKKFFIIYDTYISEKNIRYFFNHPIDLFIKCLIRDELDKISSYIDKDYVKNNKKRKIKKCTKTKLKR